MKFRSELVLDQRIPKIDHQSGIFMIGSCFTTAIGEKMLLHNFKVKVNPYGTLYHSSSVAMNLLNALQSGAYHQNQIVQLNNRYTHYWTHSKISASTQPGLFKELHDISNNVKIFLADCHYIFITLGSAYHFFHKTLNTIVGNCHKSPNHLFERRLSSVEDIRRDITEVILAIRKQNDQCRIVFTVSPVRHLRDGIVENSLSKAILRVAVQNIVDLYEYVDYFPSYELLIDDLRDYRFYSADLAHPNDLATDYIWHKFSTAYFSDETLRINDQIRSLKNRLNHRPFDKTDPDYHKMLLSTKERFEQLGGSTNIDFAHEIAQIDKLLN